MSSKRRPSNVTTTGSEAPNPAPVLPQSIPRKAEDRNQTDSRLQVSRRCIYERHLPGGAYITAHAERLQHGYFSSRAVSEGDINHVDFLAITFVLHPVNGDTRRFRAAKIRASIQHDLDALMSRDGFIFPQENPRFLMYAPHLIYGAVSPESLQWTFSLSGTLGISHTPVEASLNPGATLKEQYQIFGMMRIQGSLRTLKSPFAPEYDVEDGEIVWSLEENEVQRSGLPREFTFVMLIQKPYLDSRLSFSIEVDPVIHSWFGSYPSWWLATQDKYKPLHRRPVNFRHEIGQRFEPVQPTRGFNFATLANSFDCYVNMPGSILSSNSPAPARDHDNASTTSQAVSSEVRKVGKPSTSYDHDNQAPSPLPDRAPISGGPSYGPSGEQTLNVRVILDRRLSANISPSRQDGSPQKSPSSTARRRSLRRSRSKEGLNQHGMRIELQQSPASLRTLPSASEKRYSYTLG